MVGSTECTQIFRKTAQALVDLVFTDDMEYFDSLPDQLDRELGPPLADLRNGLCEDQQLLAILDAARLVEEVATGLHPSLPHDLATFVLRMAAARRAVDAGVP